MNINHFFDDLCTQFIYSNRDCLFVCFHTFRATGVCQCSGLSESSFRSMYTCIYNFLTMWYNTAPGANSYNLHFSLNGDITQGGHPSKYWLSRCCCTSVLEIVGNRCFNIVRPLALEFGLLRMVRQPSADTHVIWVARHKVTRPQTILKFRRPSSLDYRTRHGSQSLIAMWI
jgi:hypothetical protein